jgi:hypothetical protein
MMNLRLRAGANSETACTTLGDLANQAGNARGGDMYQGYVSWTELAERMLANEFEADVVTDLVHTLRYWTLRTVPPDTHRLPALVDAELEGRERVLRRAQAELRAEMRRWRSEPATLVVVDTNIFLEPDRPVESIDWLRVVDSRPGVWLVVPLIVVHELDRLKRQGNSTTAKLARQAIRWLATTLPTNPDWRSHRLSGEAHRGVTVEIVVQDGPARPDDADGVIIDFARQLGTISGMATRLVTRDFGMQIRAQARGVDALLLDTAPGEQGDQVLRG